MGRDSNKIKVAFLSRKPHHLGNFSIELFYRLVRENLKEPFVPVYKEMPFLNTGLLKRLGNTIYSVFNQGTINHITGDIHYVSTFLKKRKTVLTILDCGMLHQSTGLKHELFKLLWFKIPVKRSALITAISQATKEDIIRFTGCDEKKVEVVYVSISPAFKPSPKPFNVAQPRILQIGTASNKNIERLAKALQGVPCRLVIVGKVQDNILALLRENGIEHEIIAKRLTDEEVLEEYKKCDILTFISTLEGFGMPIVEANATGRVVITGNVTSMPEVAADAAHLVDPFSVDEMKKGFIKIINDEGYRNRLIDNGYRNWRRFSIETITDRYADLYTKVIKGISN